MKKTLAFLLCLLLLLAVPAALADSSGTCGEHLSWTLDSAGVLTVSGTGDMADYSDFSSPFSQWPLYYSIKSIVVENGVTGISAHAFRHCDPVSVSLPPSLTKVGSGAFTGYSHREYNLPDGITDLAEDSFPYSVSLYCSPGSVTARALGKVRRTFRLPGLPAQLRWDTFGEDQLLCLARLDADTASFTVPDEVEAIGTRFALSPEALVSVTLPAGLKRIEGGAFIGCVSLASLDLPPNVSWIGEHAFENCSFPIVSRIGDETARSLGRAGYAFHLGDEAWELMYEFAGAEDECKGLSIRNVPKDAKSFTVPEGVEIIGSGAFLDCAALRSVRLPSTLRIIESDAFANCSSLKSLDLPAALEELGSCAFSGCSSLKKLDLPDGITSVGWNAFNECGAVRYCAIGSRTGLSLGEANCSFRHRESGLDLEYLNGDQDSLALIGGISPKASSVTVPDGVNTIKGELIDLVQGTAPFLHCLNLEYIELPASVNSLKPAVFAGVGRQFYIKCKSGSYAEKFARRYGFQFDNGKKKVIGYKITNVEEKVSWIVSNYVTSGMSEREKARVLHDWIVYNCHYDYTYTYYYPNGVLLYGAGVCNSQATTYEKLLTKAGLANRYLAGETGNGSYWEGHAWNLVRVDGQWYHVDATWDNASMLPDSDDLSPVSGMEDYTFFLITDKRISELSHRWNSSISADENRPGSYHSNGVDYVYETCGTFELRASDHTAALTVGSKKEKNVAVPDTVSFKGVSYRVTEIRDEAFMGSGKLASLTLGENIQKIGRRAFMDCKKLKNITVRTKKLKKNSVGAEAFSGINKKAQFKCPSKKLRKAYKKYFSKAGAPGTAEYK